MSPRKLRLRRSAGPWALIAALIVAALMIAAQADAADGVDPEYVDCLTRAQRDPAGAREQAAQWEAVGGGALARHCAAIALIGLGADEQAAIALTRIGTEKSPLPEADRAAALTLAGDIWMTQQQIRLAGQAYQSAADLAPEAPEPLVGLARAAAAADQWGAAASQLNLALNLRPGDAEILTFRAAAHRRLGDNTSALRDAVKATRLDASAALAWFERGAAERALGSTDAARESWLQASMLDPDGAAGDLARSNLQRLELGD